MTSAMARVARLKYSHSDPLFRYSGLEPMSASNRESISLLLRGDVDVAFVPVTYAAQNCGALSFIPDFAVYSDGPVISAKLFRGSGRGYAAVSDTSVNALAIKRLLGIELNVVEDPLAALAEYEGVLVIGDDALRLTDAGIPYHVDTGELWRSRIGFPLVYAVMAARRDADPASIREISRSIGRSLERFYLDPAQLIAEVAHRINVSERLVREYYTVIGYRIDDRVLRGIEEELEVLGLPKC
ncbi:MAG: MqnA/MqnD/SBP family protein [Nitrososphaeria archaeon]